MHTRTGIRSLPLTLTLALATSLAACGADSVESRPVVGSSPSPPMVEADGAKEDVAANDETSNRETRKKGRPSKREGERREGQAAEAEEADGIPNQSQGSSTGEAGGKGGSSGRCGRDPSCYRPVETQESRDSAPCQPHLDPSCARERQKPGGDGNGSDAGSETRGTQPCVAADPTCG
jgi:hypothetical protein